MNDDNGHDDLSDADDESDDAPGGPGATETESRKRRRRAILLEALLEGRTDAQAAAAARCSVKTVRRDRQDEDFKRELDEAREEFFAAHSGRLLGTIDRARETLVACLDSESESIRIRAADLLLRAAERFHRTHTTDSNLADVTATFEGVPEKVQQILDIVGDDDGEMA